MNPLQEEMMHRFCRYVRIPSQSKPNGGTQVPSTESQWDMARTLMKECEDMRLIDLSLSDKCVLTGRLPAHT